MRKYVVVGGAGFIGSHLVHTLLLERDVKVVVLDDFSSGREWHFPKWMDRLVIAKGAVEESGPVMRFHMEGAARVFHFASNADIAASAEYPSLDFDRGTRLTHCVLEAVRRAGVKEFTYASGSGVYGDRGDVEVHEGMVPEPTSTYGASKLAGEAMCRAYAATFGISCVAYRFANVVGERQTHGVIHDFAKRIVADPSKLKILGDGRQTKSYLHVQDAVTALWSGLPLSPGFDVFNVATQDYVSVREIADAVVAAAKLKDVPYEFSGGPVGWKGDVPVIRFNTDKIRRKGWRNRLNSRDAVRAASVDLVAAAREGKLDKKGHLE